MKHSLECRVPFLDHNIVDLVFSAPFEYNIDTGLMAGKMMMRKVAEIYFPNEIVYRPKQTFPSPSRAKGQACLLGLVKENLQEMKKSEVLNFLYDLKEIEKTLPRLSFMELWQILAVWRWEECFGKIKAPHPIAENRVVVPTETGLLA